MPKGKNEYCIVEINKSVMLCCEVPDSVILFVWKYRKRQAQHPIARIKGIKKSRAVEICHLPSFFPNFYLLIKAQDQNIQNDQSRNFRYNEIIS